MSKIIAYCHLSIKVFSSFMSQSMHWHWVASKVFLYINCCSRKYNWFKINNPTTQLHNWIKNCFVFRRIITCFTFLLVLINRKKTHKSLKLDRWLCHKLHQCNPFMKREKNNQWILWFIDNQRWWCTRSKFGGGCFKVQDSQLKIFREKSRLRPPLERKSIGC
jgi:hypothetical protein